MTALVTYLHSFSDTLRWIVQKTETGMGSQSERISYKT